MSSINAFPREVLWYVFSFINPSDEIKSRRVCKEWNTQISNDPRWEKIIKERNMLPRGSTLPFLSHVQRFCVKVCEYFPIQFPKASAVVDDLPATLTKLDSEKPSLEKICFDEEFAKGLAEVSKTLEKMQLVSFKPNCSFLGRELRKATSTDPTKIPEILEKISFVIRLRPLCEISIFDMEEANRNRMSRKYVPEILKVIENDQFKNFDNTALCCSMCNSTEFVPLLLDAMKKGGNAPEKDAIYMAIERCPQHIPLIVQAMRGVGRKPDRYVLETVQAKCPEYVDVIKSAMES